MILRSIEASNQCQACISCITVTDQDSLLSGGWTLLPGQNSSGLCGDGGCKYVKEEDDSREHCFCFIPEGGQVSHEVCPPEPVLQTPISAEASSNYGYTYS